MRKSEVCMCDCVWGLRRIRKEKEWVCVWSEVRMDVCDLQWKQKRDVMCTLYFRWNDRLVDKNVRLRESQESKKDKKN